MAREPDVFDYDYEDEHGEGDGFSEGGCRRAWRPPQPRQCRQCGAGGLHWEQDEDGWYLAEVNGHVHQCDEKRLHKNIANGFDILP